MLICFVEIITGIEVPKTSSSFQVVLNHLQDWDYDYNDDVESGVVFKKHLNTQKSSIPLPDMKLIATGFYNKDIKIVVSIKRL